nr:hypothetical protein [Marinobacter sp. AC-23]
MARSSGFLDTLLTSNSTERYRIGFSLLFLLGVWLVVGAFSEGLPNSTLLMAAAVIGGYMAINIGANDVANNVGPAVAPEPCLWAPRLFSRGCLNRLGR